MLPSVNGMASATVQGQATIMTAVNAFIAVGRSPRNSHQ